MLLLGLGVLLVAAAVLLAVLLSAQPVVPAQLPGWPSLGFLYLQLLRSAVKGKKPPTSLQGKPIKVQVTSPARFDLNRYHAYLKLVGFKDAPPRVPLSYPFVEAFRLSMLAMSHKHFPFNVLGAVLARNSSRMARAVTLDEPLTYTTEVDHNYVKNDKGDYEIIINTTACDQTGQEVWSNSLTVIVINPKRQRGGGAKPAAGQESSAPKPLLLAGLSVPGNAGRAYGALTADRNPIHLSALTSQLFGFKRPIAHAMYLVARLEAALDKAGYIPYSGPQSYPITFSTEFKRPTPLPAKLQAVVDPAAQPGSLPLKACVLTGNGEKEVIVGLMKKA